MKSVMICCAVMFTAPLALAESFKYPELNEYKAQAEKALQEAQNPSSSRDFKALVDDTQLLVRSGQKIMKLYGEKNPNCQAQYTALLAYLPRMETLSLDDVMTKYHDGDGLPSAPKHCYFGRSEVVHPVMNAIRLKGKWNEVQEEVVDEFEEVIAHLPQIQKNLDNPPN